MIPHNRLSIGSEEHDASIRVLKSGWLAQGSEVQYFENEFSDYIGLPTGHAVAVSSGTSALFLALWALQAKNKRIAFPVYVCSALRNAVAMAGGEEVLLDTERLSPNIDIEALNSTQADIAIVPHMYGIPVDIDKIVNLEVIEDCAQCLGARVRGIITGIHGRLGIFSFYATKIITAGGQGGIVVSREKALIDSIRDFRDFDRRKDRKVRFNFQMTDLQATIAREQLKKLPRFLERRERIFQEYRKTNLKFIDTTNNTLEPVRYRAVMIVPEPHKIAEQLNRENIRSIIPIEEWEILGEKASFPNAYELSSITLSLPLYPSLSDEDYKKIINTLNTISER